MYEVKQREIKIIKEKNAQPIPMTGVGIPLDTTRVRSDMFPFPYAWKSGYGRFDSMQTLYQSLTAKPSMNNDGSLDLKMLGHNRSEDCERLGFKHRPCIAARPPHPSNCTGFDGSEGYFTRWDFLNPDDPRIESTVKQWAGPGVVFSPLYQDQKAKDKSEECGKWLAWALRHAGNLKLSESTKWIMDECGVVDVNIVWGTIVIYRRDINFEVFARTLAYNSKGRYRFLVIIPNYGMEDQKTCNLWGIGLCQGQTIPCILDDNCGRLLTPAEVANLLGLAHVTKRVDAVVAMGCSGVGACPQKNYRSGQTTARNVHCTIINMADIFSDDDVTRAAGHQFKENERYCINFNVRAVAKRMKTDKKLRILLAGNLVVIVMSLYWLAWDLVESVYYFDGKKWLLMYHQMVAEFGVYDAAHYRFGCGPSSQGTSKIRTAEPTWHHNVQWPGGPPPLKRVVASDLSQSCVIQPLLYCLNCRKQGTPHGFISCCCCFRYSFKIILRDEDYLRERKKYVRPADIEKLRLWGGAHGRDSPCSDTDFEPPDDPVTPQIYQMDTDDSAIHVADVPSELLEEDQIVREVQAMDASLIESEVRRAQQSAGATCHRAATEEAMLERVRVKTQMHYDYWREHGREMMDWTSISGKASKLYKKTVNGYIHPDWLVRFEALINNQGSGSPWFIRTWDRAELGGYMMTVCHITARVQAFCIVHCGDLNAVTLAYVAIRYVTEELGDDLGFEFGHAAVWDYGEKIAGTKSYSLKTSPGNWVILYRMLIENGFSAVDWWNEILDNTKDPNSLYNAKTIMSDCVSKSPIAYRAIFDKHFIEHDYERLAFCVRDRFVWFLGASTISFVHDGTTDAKPTPLKMNSDGTEPYYAVPRDFRVDFSIEADPE